MPSEAQKRADRKYKHDKTRQLCLRFYPSEAEMWSFLSAQENKQGFLKGLISREMQSAPDGNVSTFRSADMRRSERGASRHGPSANGSAYNGGLDTVGRTDS